MDYREEDYLALSGIQHFAYCRRQWALIHIEQQWNDNFFTASGNAAHEMHIMEQLLKREKEQ